jgi:ornithine decarboxylase
MTIAAPLRQLSAAADRLGEPVGRLGDALQIAASLRPEQPVLCFAAEALAARARRFLTGFPGETAYAVKCNPAPEIVMTAAAAGIGVFDVASLVEVELVGTLAPAARIHYHNPVKSRAEIAHAYGAFGVRRFAADSAEEIAKIVAVTGGDRSVEIAVRFRLPAHGRSAHDFSSKFGVDPGQATALLQLVASRGLVPVLTFHPGSQCTDPGAYARHIAAAGGIVARSGVQIRALNVGGGFPSRYLGADAPALETFFEAIADAASAAFPNGAPMLECEPGRGLVAPSMSLLARVKAVRPASREVFLNDGIYGSLLEVAQAPQLQPPYRVIRDGRTHRADVVAWTVYGPTCDPLDKLPNALLLPADLGEDDFVEFGALGAYGGATATRFNGYGDARIIAVERVLEA